MLQIVMSEEGSSSGGSGEVAQAGLSQEMLACIRAVVEEVMDKRRSHRRDSAVERALPVALPWSLQAQ